MIARPHRPRFHGPKAIGSLQIRLKIMITMGIRYEERNPATTSDTMALKATEDPILIRPRRALITPVRAMVQRGIA